MSGTRAISTASGSKFHQVFFFQQGKVQKEIHTILTETLAFSLPGRAKGLSAPLYIILSQDRVCILLTQLFLMYSGVRKFINTWLF